MSDKDQFLESALAIGDQLCNEAIVHGERAVWSGAEMALVDDDWQAVEATVGGDLYGGTAGIGLFLARLASATDKSQYADYALKALRHALAVAGPLDGSLYGGTIGIVGAAIEASDLLDAPEMGEIAEQLSVAEPAAADLIVGSAGMIIGALELHRRRPDGGWHERATRWGEDLLDRSETTDDGSQRWWPSDIGDDEPALLGLAHGAAGCAWALAELAAATRRPDLFESAMQAVQYERSWFDPDRGNWPDLRGLAAEEIAAGKEPAWPVYWCHGGPGVGLTRLRMHQISGDRRLADEASASMVSALRFAVEMAREPALHDASLCHGLAGVIELLRSGAAVLSDDKLAQSAVDVANITIELGVNLWPSGVRGGGESPSLMLGMAGIGSALLNLAIAEPRPVGLLWSGRSEASNVNVKFASLDVARSTTSALVRSNHALRMVRSSKSGRVLFTVAATTPPNDVIKELANHRDVEWAELDGPDRSQH